MKAVKLKHSDRVRRISDGATAKVIDVHPDAPRISVLPDEGPRQLKVWERAQVDLIAGNR